jgi:hypothetical protein
LRNAAILALTLVVVSILAWSVFNQILEAVQFWYNIYTPLINIITLYALYLLYKNNKVLHFVIACIFYISINNPTKAYSHLISRTKKSDFIELKKIITPPQNTNKNGAKFVFIKNFSEYNSVYEKSVFIYHPVEPLSYIFNRLNITCISIFDIKSDDKLWGNTEKELIKLTPFFHFVEKQKNNSTFISIEHSQIEFIIKHKINYLILSPKSEYPKHLEIFLGDYYEFENWKIYKLNY